MSDAKQLREIGDHLFGKKQPLNSLHQEISDHFYPERATFTINRALGSDFASNMMTSFPILCRRDLGDQVGMALRPTAKSWFHPARRFNKKEDTETKQCLQWFEETQRRAMYDPAANLTKAAKLGDHDFAAFGQCVISVELNHRSTGLLFRCWHLRDMAWQEDESGQIGAKFRRWKPSALTLSRLFTGRVSNGVTKLVEKTPFEEVEVLHMVVEADMYDGKAGGRPWWSIWYDTTFDHLIEATPQWGKHYVIPRWLTSDSQYAYSPAVVAALPDARLLQAMTFTLLEAGEKGANPPMIATQDAVRSDVAVYAGGITWIDQEYDERLGEALRPITQDFKGFQYGVEMARDSRLLLREAFYLNKLTIPERGRDMTAFEVGQRVQEYIRGALPLFEPMEQEYNAELCDAAFELLWRNGAFGSPLDWPDPLRGADIEFRFESPLHDLIEQQKGQKMLESLSLIAQAVQLDPSVSALPKAEVMLRDALNGIGAPAKWQNTEADVDAARKAAQQRQQTQELLAGLEQGSNVVKNIGQSGAVPQQQAVPA